MRSQIERQKTQDTLGKNIQKITSFDSLISKKDSKVSSRKQVAKKGSDPSALFHKPT